MYNCLALTKQLKYSLTLRSHKKTIFIQTHAASLTTCIKAVCNYIAVVTRIYLQLFSLQKLRKNCAENNILILTSAKTNTPYQMKLEKNILFLKKQKSRTLFSQ